MHRGRAGSGGVWLAAYLIVALAAGELASANDGRSASRAEAGGVATRTVELRVSAPDPDQSVFAGAPLPAMRGTLVRMLASGFERPVVSVDRHASEVLEFADSTGRSLRRPTANATGGGADQAGSEGFNTRRRHVDPIAPDVLISRDGSRVMFAARGRRLPASDATAVHLKAQLAVRVGIGQKQRTVEAVPLEAGAAVIEDARQRAASTQPASNGLITIARAGESNWGKEPMHVHLRLKGDLADRFVRARFMDGEGNDITARQMPTVAMAETIQVPFGLTKQVDEATIEVTFYETLELRTAPVDVRAGLGLDKSVE